MDKIIKVWEVRYCVEFFNNISHLNPTASNKIFDIYVIIRINQSAIMILDLVKYK